MSDIITRDDNGDLAVRTVAATEDAGTSQYDDLYARTTDGKRALRVVGAGGGSGGGDVSSVNGKKGDVVLTGADISSTLTGTGAPVTATVTEHLQTLKNDESALGEQVSTIEEKIPANASTTNQLATKDDLSKIDALPSQTGNAGKFLTTDGTAASWAETGSLSEVAHDATLAGSGTEASPLKVADNTFLPIAGGTLNGELKISIDDPGVFVPVISFQQVIKEESGAEFGTPAQIAVDVDGSLYIGHDVNVANLMPFAGGVLGGAGSKQWENVYTKKLNNGADLIVPNKAGTLATLEDLQGISSDVVHDDTLSGTGTAESPLSVVKPTITLTTFEA